MAPPHHESALRAEARKRAKRARRIVRHAGRWARWHQLVYYAPIVIGVVAGTIGGIKGLKDNDAEIAGWAAALAAASTALSLKFTKESEFGLADVHWRRRAAFNDLAQKYERLAIGERVPTDDDFETLEEAERRLETPGAAGS
jgi:hypothetical protein